MLIIRIELTLALNGVGLEELEVLLLVDAAVWAGEVARGVVQAAVLNFDLRQVERIEGNEVGRHDARLGRVHQAEGLLVHRRVLVVFVGGSGSRDVAATWGMLSSLLMVRIVDRAFVGRLIEVDEVAALLFDREIFKFLEQLLGHLAAVVGQKMIELLGAVADQLVHLEEEIGLVAEQLAGHVLVLVVVHDARVAHSGQHCLHEVLEPLIHQGLHLALELGRPLIFGEVIVEILLNLGLDQLLSLEYPLVDRVKVHEEHVHIQRAVI